MDVDVHMRVRVLPLTTPACSSRCGLCAMGGLRLRFSWAAVQGVLGWTQLRERVSLKLEL